ncbi:hypothetical protein Tco_0747460 [Tanacetum coccineum]|uniref:Uncharacterized protein n=1 Tax=Tanacetum coccineum TaxID=301880 RepID=A0ABQ4YST3_9ASTR
MLTSGKRTLRFFGVGSNIMLMDASSKKFLSSSSKRKRFQRNIVGSTMSSPGDMTSVFVPGNRLVSPLNESLLCLTKVALPVNQFVDASSSRHEEGFDNESKDNLPENGGVAVDMAVSSVCSMWPERTIVMSISTMPSNANSEGTAPDGWKKISQDTKKKPLIKGNGMKIKLSVSRESSVDKSHEKNLDATSSRKDLESERFQFGATSSSSKVSGSFRRASLKEVKGSPVGTVSSSPLKAPNLDKLSPAAGRTISRKAHAKSSIWPEVQEKLLEGEGKEEGKAKRARDKLINEPSKKQKVDDNTNTSELKELMQIIPDEKEVAIDAIHLPVKAPKIVGWKIYKEGKKSYYQIIRADGKSQMYMIFSQMLRSFDREDLEDLYKLVKAKYGSTRPVEDLDLLLWGDLKTMFEPSIEDDVWRQQQGYKV